MNFRHILLLFATAVCGVEEKQAVETGIRVGGEVEFPERIEFEKAGSFGDLLAGAKPLVMGAVNRVKIFREGLIHTVNSRKNSDFPLKPGDVVEVPAKSLYGGGYSGERVTTVVATRPDDFLERVGQTDAKRWTAVTNWWGGVEGVDLRPVGKAGEAGGVSVFIRPSTGNERAEALKADGKDVPEAAVFSVVSRNWEGGSEDPAEFMSEALKMIREAAAAK